MFTSKTTTTTSSVDVDVDGKAQAQKELPIEIQVRKSSDRGHDDHGWLNTYHTFSFGGYHDPKFAGFNNLYVINEDRVQGGRGFGKHPHSNFEIFSYVVSGSIQHEDSMGNKEVISRGDVQFTSAGKGIAHSEFNASKKDLVHFLQIWVQPDQKNLKPTYSTKRFEDKEKDGKLCLIVGPKNEKHGGIIINQDVKVFTCLLKKGQEISYSLPNGRDLYLHHIQDVTGYSKEADATRLVVNDVILKPGDGAFIARKKSLETSSSESSTPVVTIKGGSEERAEFLLFDLIHRDGVSQDDDDY